MKKFILLFFMIWRVILFSLYLIADKLFFYDPSFPYAKSVLGSFGMPQWFYSWGGFDGVHYIVIAKNGYIGTGLIQAFFPLYPFLIKITNTFVHNFLLSGLLISNLIFFIFLFVWYDFIKQRYSEKIAFLSSVLILIFPTSFFFGAIYSESLFLLLVILTFHFAEKKHYLISSILIALASATRLVGLFLIPAVLIEIFFENYNFKNLIFTLFKKNKKQLRTQLKLVLSKLKLINKKIFPIFLTMLGSIGLLSYMTFLYLEFKDPLYFFHVQSEFGGIRQESLILYPQVLFRYFKILLTTNPLNILYLSSLREFLVATLGLVVIIYSFTKVKFSYFTFAILAFVLPTLTGTFSSLPRYVLVSFPIFIVLALWAEKNRKFMMLWFACSTILLLFNTMLFIQGYWIA